MEGRWQPIPGFEGNYEISESGAVRTVAGSLLKPDTGRVTLSQNGTRIRISIVKLLTTVFPETVSRLPSSEGEEWKPIPGFEGIYDVSNHYRVRRRPGISDHGQHDVERTLAAKILSVSRNNGYLVAYLGGNGNTGKNSKKFYVEAAVENLFGIKNAIVDDLSEPGEEWRDIPGYESLYQTSTHGRVRSIGRYVKGECVINVNIGPKRRYIRPHLLPGNAGSTGYRKVELSAKGVIKTLMVHRLVAITFIPNPLNLDIVHHKDENKLNNRADNLEWVSRAGNVQDWFDRRRVVVSADMIETILAASATGKTPSEILAALPRKRKPRKS